MSSFLFENFCVHTEEVGSVHVHTTNVSCEPIGYNTKIDTEGIVGAC